MYVEQVPQWFESTLCVCRHSCHWAVPFFFVVTDALSQVLRRNTGELAYRAKRSNGMTDQRGVCRKHCELFPNSLAVTNDMTSAS